MKTTITKWSTESTAIDAVRAYERYERSTDPGQNIQEFDLTCDQRIAIEILDYVRTELDDVTLVLNSQRFGPKSTKFEQKRTVCDNNI